MDLESNLWCGFGEAQSLTRGKLKNGDEAASFQVLSTTRSGGLTWVRINVFDQDLFRYVKNRVRKGKRVYVEGELMNRRLGGKNGPEVTEIRAFEVKVISRNETRKMRGDEDGKSNNSVVRPEDRGDDRTGVSGHSEDI